MQMLTHKTDIIKWTLVIIFFFIGNRMEPAGWSIRPSDRPVEQLCSRHRRHCLRRQWRGPLHQRIWIRRHRTRYILTDSLKPPQDPCNGRSFQKRDAMSNDREVAIHSNEGLFTQTNPEKSEKIWKIPKKSKKIRKIWKISKNPIKSKKSEEI